jgi:hypothetical protein
VSQLFILILLGVVGSICYKYWKYRAEQRLRENPPPRRVIEVSLPRGEDNSADRMARALRTIAHAAMGDKKARRTGMRQIDIVYMFEVPKGKMEAIGRYLLYCDPDKMDTVRRAIKQTYGQVAAVQEISADDDPMAEIAAALRPPAPRPADQTADIAPAPAQSTVAQIPPEMLAQLASEQTDPDLDDLPAESPAELHDPDELDLSHSADTDAGNFDTDIDIEDQNSARFSAEQAGSDDELFSIDEEFDLDLDWDMTDDARA